jgi:hypothetical protein
MQTLRNKLTAVAVMASLAVIGSIMNSRDLSAQPNGNGSAPVTIVGPLPVPVSGAMTVSGAIAAAQSGAWNVGIAGNSAANPLNVKNVDERGRNPFQERFICFTGPGNSGRCTAVGNAVPPNKRLVIEHVSAALITDTGKGIEETEIGNSINGSAEQFLFSRLENFNIPGARDTYYVNEHVLLYVESGQQPYFRAKTATFSSISVNAYISGYLVNLGI